MQWRITNRSAKDNYVVSESINPIGYEYRGFMENFQPNGHGALYKNGNLVKCGYWENGELSEENMLSFEDYNNAMNEYFNH